MWTAPLTTLNRLAGVAGVDLEYLSTIFYNIEVNRPPKHDFQWTYFGGDEMFSRVTAPEAFLSTTTPPGKSGLCVEFTCREGDERWQDPERYTAQVIADLVRTGALERADDVDRVHIERVPFTYPIYKLNYLGELTRNLKTLGRYSESAARRALRPVLVQQHGSLDRSGPDHGRQDRSRVNASARSTPPTASSGWTLRPSPKRPPDEVPLHVEIIAEL